MDYLEANLNLLRSRQPDLADVVASSQPSGTVQVTSAESGEKTAVVRLADGTSKRLHSRHNPRRDAAQWAEGIKLTPSKSVALMGLGLGYHLEELLKCHSGLGPAIWCFESSIDVFREMLSWKDWSSILSDPRVRFLVGADEAAFRRIAARGFQQVMVDGIEVVEIAPLVAIDPDWYAARRASLRDLIRQWSSEVLTVMERGPLFQTNVLRNFRGLSTSYLFRDVGPSLKGRPAIMVSAGPSLNKNAAQLAGAKGKIPIVSVDTSLRILQRHGVVPDLVVSIDGLGMSVRHFEGVEGLDQIPLAYDLEVTPDVLANYPGPKFLVGNTKPLFYTWLEEVTGPLEKATKGLTVAQAAFHLLVRHGASPIIVVGQDLSFEREGGKTHAEGAAFQGRFEPGQLGQGKWEDPLRPEGLQDIPVLWVPANDGGQVPTTHTLFAYLKRFEEDIAETGAKVLNATGGGAFIQGTEVVTLTEALRLQNLDALPPFIGFRRSDEIRRIGDQYEEELESMRREMLVLLNQARTSCEAGIEKSRRLRNDLTWKHPTLEQIQRSLGEVQDAFGVIRSSKKIQMLIDRGVMKSLYMLHKGDLPPVDKRTPQDHRIVAERYEAFFLEALSMVEFGERILGP